ncbi:PIR protein, putative [Plasmodium sp. gorilla clade G1]|nr:PIR protein, putative [Plasmodium sp. gorilla clade G1]
MKVHYINILMFALALNILVYNQRNHKSITLHTPKENSIKTHRSLCECELYAPRNYDNDPEMKSLVKDFDRRTSQRLREYDERMNKNRQKCKDQCDKYIQKIILKDKIENELKEKLATLETNINTEDLPICECEKSLTDKVEKGCLGCGVLGSGIAPNVGLFGEVVLGAWKSAALVTAEKLAAKAGAAKGAAAGHAEGLSKFIDGFKEVFFINSLDGKPLETFFSTTHTDVANITKLINMRYDSNCGALVAKSTDSMCEIGYTLDLGSTSRGLYIPPESIIGGKVNEIATQAKTAATLKASEVTTAQTAAIETAKKGVIETTCMGYEITIIASIVAILVIVLVMVIIYLILHYRRKKKMKKKLQYIKLLKE